MNNIKNTTITGRRNTTNHPKEGNELIFASKNAGRRRSRVVNWADWLVEQEPKTKKGMTNKKTWPSMQKRRYIRTSGIAPFEREVSQKGKRIRETWGRHYDNLKAVVQADRIPLVIIRRKLYRGRSRKKLSEAARVKERPKRRKRATPTGQSGPNRGTKKGL